MATTTNYSWTTPDNTAYVKDGASAIRTLGSSVDTTLFTALGGTYPGLRLIKKQTIGTAVSSVTVTSAFSATYENYKIIISGGVGSAANILLNFTLGGITTNYRNAYAACGFQTTTVQGSNNSSNTARWAEVGSADASNIYMNMDLFGPFLTKTTIFSAPVPYLTAAGNGAINSGANFNSTSATDFTVTTQAGTLTGGTIYVYGYGIS